MRIKTLLILALLQSLLFIPQASAKPAKKPKILTEEIVLERNKSTYHELSVKSGKKPYTFSSTNLPSGLALSSDGKITGTPTQSAYKQRVKISVTDANQKKSSKNITIKLLGESYDLSFTQLDKAPCTENTSVLCNSIDFVATNIGYSRALGEISISGSATTQAGIVLLKKFSDLNVANGNSYNFNLNFSQDHTFLQILLTDLKDSNNSSTATEKQYTLTKDDSGNFHIGNIIDNIVTDY